MNALTGSSGRRALPSSTIDAASSGSMGSVARGPPSSVSHGTLQISSAKARVGATCETLTSSTLSSRDLLESSPSTL